MCENMRDHMNMKCVCVYGSTHREGVSQSHISNSRQVHPITSYIQTSQRMIQEPRCLASVTPSLSAHSG